MNHKQQPEQVPMLKRKPTMSDLVIVLRKAYEIAGMPCLKKAADRIEELEAEIQNVASNPLGSRIQRDRIKELEEELRKANLVACLVPVDKALAVLNSEPSKCKP